MPRATSECDGQRRTMESRHVRYDDSCVLPLTAADARLSLSTSSMQMRSVWATAVARLSAFEPHLAVNIVTQVHLGISPVISHRQVVVEQFNVLARRLTAAAQRSNPVATQRATSVAPMHVTDLESGSVTASWNAIVRRALRDSPSLFHVVHLEVAERDVPCVAKAATYNALVLRESSGSSARGTSTYLHRSADSQC